MHYIQINKGEYPFTPGVKFTGANLAYATTLFADFSGVDFTGANLYGVAFQYDDLKGAIINDADLTKIDFYHSDLGEAEIKSSNLTSGRISSGSNVRGTDFAGSNFDLVELRDSDLSGALNLDFSGAIVNRSTIFPEGSVYSVLGDYSICPYAKCINLPPAFTGTPVIDTSRYQEGILSVVGYGELFDPEDGEVVSWDVLWTVDSTIAGATFNTNYAKSLGHDLVSALSVDNIPYLALGGANIVVTIEARDSLGRAMLVVLEQSIPEQP
jgi:uncharacterized protein YjbI with pentapeptide repeats